MNINTVVIQAGGRGSRMGWLTDHKPKCLVPVDNKPMLFHLMDHFPNARFVVVADYRADVLERYLRAFCRAPWTLVRAQGQGSLAGIGQALELLNGNEPFALVWSDLVPAHDTQIEALPEGNWIGLVPGMDCRYRYHQGRVEPVSSDTDGVAGFFVFAGKDQLPQTPPEGEFADYLGNLCPEFRPLSLSGWREVGTLQAWNRLASDTGRSRGFNRVTVVDDLVCKEPIDDQGRKLARLEVNWYRTVLALGYGRIPEIHSLEPLCMERIGGKHPFELDGDQPGGPSREAVLDEIFETLGTLHELSSGPADRESLWLTYGQKTLDRVGMVLDLVPGGRLSRLVVNGKRCAGMSVWEEEIRQRATARLPAAFCLIHGDPTFSNILIRETSGKAVLIDPRGYFGRQEELGDPAYDYAKLYYSLSGHYDQINRNRFTLSYETEPAEEHDRAPAFRVTVRTEQNGWEGMEEAFFDRLPPGHDRETILFLQGVIWLSVTSYFQEHYDAVCAAYYLGCYHMQLWKEACDARSSE